MPIDRVSDDPPSTLEDFMLGFVCCVLSIDISSSPPARVPEAWAANFPGVLVITLMRSVPANEAIASDDGYDSERGVDFMSVFAGSDGYVYHVFTDGPSSFPNLLGLLCSFSDISSISSRRVCTSGRVR